MKSMRSDEDELSAARMEGGEEGEEGVLQHCLLSALVLGHVEWGAEAGQCGDPGLCPTPGSREKRRL